ncbi:MAG: histidine--tRNA ligase [Deltaproteobacteria bacterium RIFCSPLOWO2_02_FULL_53_8]|nr:MAG: histidine--tRNA ligase [Deltaproteobacteria bacterium RIFCSPLOWO2_02_FULL_53_8]
MSITAVKGFNDILPNETFIWKFIEQTACRIFTSYGYSEIKVPVVEKTELFMRSIGETTDIVEKEMYSFLDRHGDGLTLRPEGTASVVRAYIEHKLYTAPINKLFYYGPMFRYERPQKGRYRQFYQIGAEVMGEDHPFMDAETIEMLVEFFKEIGLQGITLYINSLGCAECRPGYKQTLTRYLEGVKDRLCENCQRRLSVNPLRALDCKSTGCIAATQDAPKITDSLCTRCKQHFIFVTDSLSRRGIIAIPNPRMVRGLDYYTKTTFEITAAAGLGAQNAVAAGGRYDGLVKDLGGPATPCFGFAMGMERVALLLQETGLRSVKEPPLCAFIALGKEAEMAGTAIIKILREDGLRVVEVFTEGGLKTRMKMADRLGAGFAIILGEDELKTGKVIIKDMKTATQDTINLLDAATALKAACA